MTQDFAVAPAVALDGDDLVAGRLMLHRVDCPVVEVMRQAGEPVMTLLQCEGDPDPNMPRCDCLEPSQ